MFIYTKGDILKADAEALVNSVNCVGVMGKGLALSFKKAHPDNFKAYEKACSRGEIQPGRVYVYDTGRIIPRYIINFPTKRHWRSKSLIEDIEQGLVDLVEQIKSRNISSIAIPPLGSGLGGLKWSNVRPLIEDKLAELKDVTIYIYEPDKQFANQPASKQNKPKMTAGRAALVGLADRYLAALMDPSISLIELHKLMYFLQEAGEPLRLRFVRAQYGPYAENLRHVLRAIDDHLIVGYGSEVDNPNKQITIMPGAVKEATDFLATNNKTALHFEQVVKLVEGYETPTGLELLATVHWLAVQENIKDTESLVQAVHNWIPRKKQFMPKQIENALSRLSEYHWIKSNFTQLN
jgi:O-acetyl-ADP-ribose deacetylase (regulator of RNase III)